jgi:hypothetical protein
MMMSGRALHRCGVAIKLDFGGELQFRECYKSTSAEISAALTTDREFDYGKRVRAAGECC